MPRSALEAVWPWVQCLILLSLCFLTCGRANGASHRTAMRIYRIKQWLMGSARNTWWTLVSSSYASLRADRQVSIPYIEPTPWTKEFSTWPHYNYVQPDLDTGCPDIRQPTVSNWKNTCASHGTCRGHLSATMGRKTGWKLKIQLKTELIV